VYAVSDNDKRTCSSCRLVLAVAAPYVVVVLGLGPIPQLQLLQVQATTTRLEWIGDDGSLTCAQKADKSA